MKITVFTPTYNRVDKLPRLFDSLMRQTCPDFEWLVVDDGSSDGTAELMNRLQATATFPVHYIRKENGGKHTAYNMALEYAAGEWLVCLDSDDMLTEGAVEILCAEMDKEADGTVAYKADLDGRLLGSPLPMQVKTLHISDLGARYGCAGDYVFAYKTAIARQFPFPEFPGERFSPEGTMLDPLGQACTVSVTEQVLMRCEYQPDGYSAQAYKLIRENPCAYAQCYKQRIDLPTSFKSRAMNAARYHCYRRFGGKKVDKYNGPHRLLTAVCVPLGWMLYLYYKLLRGF